MKKFKLQKIFNNFSEYNQLQKLREECTELIEAIDAFLESDCKIYMQNDMTKNLKEEIADVKTVIEQFGLVFDLETIQKEKIDRTLKRIEEGFYS